MTPRFEAVQEGREKQLLNDGAFHDWYRFVLAFPDHLVVEICERFGITDKDTILDPFCGTGTTLVECKKLGIHSVGIEANPVCVFASQVKTNWEIDPRDLRDAAQTIVRNITPQNNALSLAEQPLFATISDVDGLKEDLLASSPEAQYFIASGMLAKKWLSEIPFYKTVLLLNEIKRAKISKEIQNTLKLAVAAILVETVANISFGPELYISGEQKDADVLGAFSAKVAKMATDLEAAQASSVHSQTHVFLGDSRECARILIQNQISSVDFVITSPPYPTEKDYTRQTRLELIFLGYVYDRKSLQAVKQAMIRSHSKGIYRSDHDGNFVRDIPEVRAIADELRMKVADKTYGFAKLYPRIIEEYFGGMCRHLINLFHILRDGGKCAYVVGDQRTYLQTYTPTGRILAILAERIGFKVVDTLVWRVRKGTTGSREEIKEEIVLLQKPSETKSFFQLSLW